MTEFESIILHNRDMSFSGLALGEGPLVLLLHGFPDNARSWRHQMPVLAAAGYRTVAMNMRGYEPQSQPQDGDYSMESIATDVLAFLDQLEVNAAHLVGHDWGAAVSYTAAARAPDRFLSLTTMAVPHAGRFLSEVVKHPKQLRLSWYMLFFQLRGLADWAVQRRDYEFIRMLWRQWSPTWDIPGDELEQVIDTFRQPGVCNGALAYYRAALSPRSFPISPEARKAAGYQVAVPTLAMTGVEDHCIDSAIFQRLMREEDFPAGMVIREISGAGHFPQQEQPDQVNALLLDWLRQHA